MNTYNINDINFINSNLYQKYLKENPVKGYLKIRAYAANEAVPISGLNVTISKIKSTMCNCGSITIPEFHEKARLTMVSNVSIKEGSAHDVQLKEIQNDSE